MFTYISPWVWPFLIFHVGKQSIHGSYQYSKGYGFLALEIEAGSFPKFPQLTESSDIFAYEGHVTLYHPFFGEGLDVPFLWLKCGQGETKTNAIEHASRIAIVWRSYLSQPFPKHVNLRENDVLFFPFSFDHPKIQNWNHLIKSWYDINLKFDTLV